MIVDSARNRLCLGFLINIIVVHQGARGQGCTRYDRTSTMRLPK